MPRAHTSAASSTGTARRRRGIAPATPPASTAAAASCMDLQSTISSPLMPSRTTLARRPTPRHSPPDLSHLGRIHVALPLGAVLFRQLVQPLVLLLQHAQLLARRVFQI